MITNLNMSCDMTMVVPKADSLDQYLDLENEVIKGLTYPYTPGAVYKNYDNKPLKEKYQELQTNLTETIVELTCDLVQSEELLKKLDEVKNSREREYALHLTGFVRLNGEPKLHARFVRNPGIVGNLMKHYVTSIKTGYKKSNEEDKKDKNKKSDNEVLVSGSLRAAHVANGSLVIPLNPVFIHAKPLGEAMTFRVWHARTFADSFATPQYPNVSLSDG